MEPSPEMKRKRRTKDKRVLRKALQCICFKKRIVVLFMEWNKTYHRRKICIIFFSVVLMSMVLCGRLVYLMLFEGKYYETQAKDLQQRERKIKAARGKILDRTPQSQGDPYRILRRNDGTQKRGINP